MIGLGCAVSLSTRGFEVTVVDAGDLGGGASMGNGGWVCPSLSAPLPAPGVVAQALRWLLRPGSPLLVRPSLDPHFWRWLLDFARHCNRSEFWAGLEAVSTMAASAGRLFESWEARGIEFELHRKGLLLLFSRRKEAVAEMNALKFMEAHGCPRAHLLDASELLDLEPITAGSGLVGILAPSDLHLRPESLTAGLDRWLSRHGVTLRSGSRSLG